MEKISIGRIVTVRDRTRLPSFQVRPAIVTAVHGPDIVDVSVFAEGGLLRELNTLSRIEANEDETLGWYWPVKVA